ncbi:HPP family protein [bacterium]|nr:HPP family protein [bacterium]
MRNRNSTQRSVSQMLQEFRSHWKHYVFQSMFAMISMFAVLLVLKFQNLVISASIGATAFIVFSMPKSVTAKPRNVIGGHMIGFVCGSLCAVIPQPHVMITLMAYALAVGFSMFFMVVFDMEHPPASGTALGVAIHGFSWPVLLALLAANIVFLFVCRIFRPYIRDLI